MTALREVVSVLGILGIPSIFAMTMYCIRACAKFSKQLKVLLDSQQAQMRSQLLKDYKKYSDQGWIDIDDLVDFENQYQKYHSLGANGVMDSKRDAILKLPNTPPVN